MPYLMLEFKADREMTGGEFGKDKGLPTGREFITFRMIDTDTGKVIELSCDASNIKQTERPANFGESHTASQVFNQEPGKRPSQIWQEKMGRLEEERDRYREKMEVAHASIDQKKKTIDSLELEIADLQSKQVKPMERELIAAALDLWIPDLAERQQFNAYEEAKALYARLTGKSWANEYGVDDDDDLFDDDEEEDPEQPDSGHFKGLAQDFGLLLNSGFNKEGKPNEFWHFEWDKDVDPPDIKVDLETSEFQETITRHVSRAEYEWMLLGESRFEMRVVYRDFEFQKNVKELEDEIFYLGRRAGKTTMSMKALLEAQREGYLRYFSREGKSEIRIPNFRLDIPTGHKQARQRQIPQSTRDVVDTKARWRQESRRKGRNTGR